MAGLKDFGTSTVLTAPSPADSGTSLVVQSGHGARFPAAPFYVTVHPPSEFPTLDNAEKLLVSSKSTDTFTIARGEGDTVPQNIEAGWRISNSFYLADIPDTFDDLIDGTTNKAYTGAEQSKLSGIEAGADVTDATNVDAAGAVMNSDTSTASMNFVIDEDNMATDSATKVPTQQSVKAYVDAVRALLTSQGLLAQTGDIWQQAGTTLPSGWLACDGTAVSRTTYSALFAELVKSKSTFTVTIASPAVVTNTAHGLYTGEGVYLTTTGALPTGLSQNTMYYVIRVDANTFNLATSLANAIAGTKINTTGSQSGTHTLYYCPWGNGDGSTTFNTPDLRDRTLVGKNTSGTFQALGKKGGAETHQLTVSEMPSHRHYVRGDTRADSVGFKFGVNGGSTTNMAQAVSNVNEATYTGTLYGWYEGGDGAHNNLQPYAVINYRIKT